MSSKTNTSAQSLTTLYHSTLSGLGSLIKLLPTGTVFMFQFLSPVLTNNGHCHVINRYLTSILIVICGFNCCFSSFTDSYVDSQGLVHYGIATTKGLWPNTSAQDLSSNKLRLGDFVHAFFSLIVFCVVSLLDPNIVSCFYPSFESAQRVLLMVLPPVVGAASGVVFVWFPNNRHGIGYPYSPSQTSSIQASSSSA